MRSSFSGSAVFLCRAASLCAQIPINLGSTTTETFNSVGTSASATLPASWKMTAAGVVAPTWNDGTNVAAVTAQASSGQPTTGGRYNWGSAITTSDRSIGFMTSGGYASPNSIMAQFRNNTGATLNAVTVGFDIERYRSNTAAASVAFFYSLDGSTWTAVAAGDVGNAAIPAGANMYDFAVSGGAFVSVVNRFFTFGSLNLAAADTLYLRWTFTTGAANSQGLGLDNVTISPPVPQISIQPSPQTATVGDSVTFSVTATGNSALTYQWRKGGVALPSATNSSYTINNITSANAGNYDVIVTDSLASVTSSPAALVVVKAPATITMDSLVHTYNGAPRSATATTTPAGKNVTFTYDGSATPPTNAGTYLVVGTIADADYQGTASGTFTIAKATANVTLSSLTQGYTGTARSATATTGPAGLTVDFTYDGSATPPTNIGSYALVATISSPNYQGSASGTFTITPATQSITFVAPLDHLPTDAPFALTATASSGLPVTFALVSGSPGIATLSGSTVTLTGALGSVTVRAMQAGAGNFGAALAVDRTFQVVSVLTLPAITTQPAPVIINVGETITLTGSASGAPA
ncbi:MAG TPA: MBG domain-containing protein, partial [Opitutaceae bacterium]|nr:MBG domain-containing protein [Opitutaceae bacterium]